MVVPSSGLAVPVDVRVSWEQGYLEELSRGHGQLSLSQEAPFFLFLGQCELGHLLCLASH